MKLQLNKQEQALFRHLQQSNDGKTLKGLIERLIREAVDIRNITGDVEAEKKGREVAVKLLEENFVERLKVGEGLDSVDIDNFE